MRRLALLLPVLSILACAKSAPSNEQAPASAASPDAVEREQGERHARADDKNIAAGAGEAPAAMPPGAATPSPSKTGSPTDEFGIEEESDDRDGDGDAAALDVKVPMISGGLDRDIIRRVAKDHASDVQGCVPAALADNPALSEVLALELKIDGDGSVSEAELPEDNPFTLSAVQSCVLELAKGWSFPPAKGGDATQLTLEFALAGE